VVVNLGCLTHVVLIVETEKTDLSFKKSVDYCYLDKVFVSQIFFIILHFQANPAYFCDVACLTHKVNKVALVAQNELLLYQYLITVSYWDTERITLHSVKLHEV
jgi:hypothetical protein